MVEVIARESLSTHGVDGVLYKMVLNGKYSIPADVAHALGTSVEIVGSQEPVPANIPETKDIPEPPRNKMVKKPGRRK